MLTDHHKINRKWTLGLVLLGVVVVLWVLSSYLVNILFENDLYRKPFFITYINTACFSLYLIPQLNVIRSEFAKDRVDRRSSTSSISPLVADNGSSFNNNNNNDNNNNTQSHITHTIYTKSTSDIKEVGIVYDSSEIVPSESINDINTQKGLSFEETVSLSAQFCILWFLSNFATNASLSYTSVASQTILSSTSSFFTLFIGSLCHVERLSKPKIVGSLISFAGILLITNSDTSMSQAQAEPLGMSTTATSGKSFEELTGNILALLGAACYGIYSTLLKKKVGDESRINVKLFFGFVGLITLLCLWPSLILLHLLKWETFELPKGREALLIILANCVIIFVSDFCWAKAMLLTSPLTVTVGLSITIPLAILGDFVFKDKRMSLLYLLGALCIIGSFLAISMDAEKDDEAASSETLGEVQQVQQP